MHSDYITIFVISYMPFILELRLHLGDVSDNNVPQSIGYFWDWPTHCWNKELLDSVKGMGGSIFHEKSGVTEAYKWCPLILSKLWDYFFLKTFKIGLAMQKEAFIDHV